MTGIAKGERMAEAEILRVLNARYPIRFDRLEFLRDSGCRAYAAFAGDRKYFLRVTKPALFDTASSALEIQVFLQKRGFAVPPILFTKENAPCVQMGALVGELHRLMEEYPGNLIKRDRQFYIGRYLDILRRKRYPRAEEFAAYGEALWERVKDLPRGYCHGDMYRGNFLKTPEGSLYLLDFDTSCEGFPLYDPALICNMTDYFQWDEDGYSKSKDVFARFLPEYAERSPFGRQNAGAFYDLIALYHFTLQATIIEIFGLDCVDDVFFDWQLDWLYRWREQCEQHDCSISAIFQEGIGVFVDLHIHTSFSDGSDTVEEVIRHASENNVSVLSITDHNTVEAYRENTVSEAERTGIKIIPGVELDVIHKGRQYHLLGYGFDIESRELLEMCEHNAAAQEESNLALLRKIVEDFPEVSEVDYEEYVTAKGRGGWKLLNYLLDSGVTCSLREGLKFYGQYQVDSSKIPFVSMAEAVKVIKKAGGIPVLAHPGENIPYNHYDGVHDDFYRVLEDILLAGVEGIECIHPLHDFVLEKDLISLCEFKGLFITGGSDYHGRFFSKGKQKVGGQFVKYETVEVFMKKLASQKKGKCLLW